MGTDVVVGVSESESESESGREKLTLVLMGLDCVEKRDVRIVEMGKGLGLGEWRNGLKRGDENGLRRERNRRIDVGGAIDEWVSDLRGCGGDGGDLSADRPEFCFRNFDKLISAAICVTYFI